MACLRCHRWSASASSLATQTMAFTRDPAEFMPNASLSKTFRITESVKLSYRIEATNVLNHTVLTMPSNTTVGPNMTEFGAITTAMAPVRSRCQAISYSGTFAGGCGGGPRNVQRGPPSVALPKKVKQPMVCHPEPFGCHSEWSPGPGGPGRSEESP